MEGVWPIQAINGNTPNNLSTLEQARGFVLPQQLAAKAGYVKVPEQPHQRFLGLKGLNLQVGALAQHEDVLEGSGTMGEPVSGLTVPLLKSG